MERTTSEAALRGSAETWLAAAFELLLESGVDAVRIATLAARLNMSRTSFYWFFKDREAILEALLSQWRDKNTGNLIRQSNAYAETLVEAVLNVSDCWFDTRLFDSRFEFAVRSWALQSAAVQGEVQKADQQRLEALSGLFRRHGHGAEAADVRARTIYLTQIGYISMQTAEDISLRMKRMPYYVEVFTDLVPQKREMDRFFARHGQFDLM